MVPPLTIVNALKLYKKCKLSSAAVLCISAILWKLVIRNTVKISVNYLSVLLPLEERVNPYRLFELINGCGIN